MSKKIGGVVVLAAMCALSLFLVNCGSSSSRPSGLLYVLTQGSNGTGNAVSSFAIDLNSGNLSLINSNASTCATAGACGLPLDIVLDPTGAAAFVLNQGIPCVQGGNCVSPCGPSPLKPCVSTPPTIYPYMVKSDGTLSAPGTPTALSHPFSASDTQDDADLSLAVVRDATGQFLFVINKGTNPPPASCLMDPLPTSNFDACPSISVFKISGTSLTLAGGSALHPGNPLHLSRIPTALSVVTVSSPAEELLFVASSKDLSANQNDNTLSVYGVGSDGTLTEKIGSPYSTSTINPLSVLAVNTNVAPQNNGGVFVYVGAAGNASGALDAFQVCTGINAACTSQSDVDNAKLLPVGTSPTSTGQNPVGMVVDPTNNFLYVVCEVQNAVYGYRIFSTTGVLTAQNPTNLSTGLQPVALAIHSSGRFLYTSNSGSSNISAFTLSTTSGSMNSLSTVNSPPGPSGMTAR
jgi:DNA-binding beta-propeller fold protein YncE